MAKPINPGNAVRTGVISALLASSGADAPLFPLEGNKGFFSAFADQVDSDLLIQGLKSEHKIATCYMKPYPACRHIHAPIDVALKLRAQGIPPLEEIENIKIYAYPAAIRTTGNIIEPANVDEAKFSLTYATAVAFNLGHFTLDDLEDVEHLCDKVQEWIHKMEIVSDPSLENRSANIRGSRIEVLLKNGQIKSEFVALPKGDPEVPLSEKDLYNKLRSCTQGVFKKEIIEKFYACGIKFEKLDSVGKLLAYFDNPL